jgi:hypothetical protein
MVKCDVLFEVQTEFLNINLHEMQLQRVKVRFLEKSSALFLNIFI